MAINNMGNDPLDQALNLRQGLRALHLSSGAAMLARNPRKSARSNLCGVGPSFILRHLNILLREETPCFRQDADGEFLRSV